MPIESPLQHLFDALEKKKICYSLLRGIREWEEDAQTKEISLLVKRPDLKNFAKTAARLGFIELPRRGYAPHYFYVAYDPAAGAWLKLDVVGDAELIKSGNPDVLARHRKVFARELFGGSITPDNAWRRLCAFLKQGLRFFRFRLKPRGLWVVLLAPDGAGKTTLARTLLKQQFLRPKLIYMGTNPDSDSTGFPASKWLKKRLKQLDGKKGPARKLLLKPLKMAAYLNRLREHWCRVGAGLYYKFSGRVVVFDRFVYDSHLAAPAKSRGQKIRRWLIYHTCPPPDAIYLLDAPGEVLFSRKGEHSPEILEKQRQTFLTLQSLIPNMVIVDATKSAEEVRSQILANIWKLYALRLNGHRKYED